MYVLTLFSIVVSKQRETETEKWREKETENN